MNNRLSLAANASKKKRIAFNHPHDDSSRPQEDGKENFMDDEPAPALLLDAVSQRALAMEVGRLTQKLDQLHKAHQATVERCEACEEQLLDAQTCGVCSWCVPPAPVSPSDAIGCGRVKVSKKSRMTLQRR